MKSNGHICGKCNTMKKAAHGYWYCEKCNRKAQTAIETREKIRLKNHPAKSDPDFEFARKWNIKNPTVLSAMEAVENYKIFTGRVTA